MTDTNQLPQIPDLTNERIDYIADLTVKGMPDGIRGFLVSWGWRQFAKALMSNFDETMRAYALQARAQVQATQAEVTDADIVAVMRDGNNCNYNDEAEHIQFARAILALRPAAVPMTDEHLSVLKEMADRCPELNLSNYDSDDVDDLNSWAVEIAVYIDGITAQPKKETP